MGDFVIHLAFLNLLVKILRNTSPQLSGHFDIVCTGKAREMLHSSLLFISSQSNDVLVISEVVQ